jgi:DNA-binding NarL/FixJ family response regulator
MSQSLETGSGGAVPVLLQRAKLLVVDDDLITLHSLERTLKEQSFEVYTAQSVVEAKALINTLVFDAALIDLRVDEDPGALLIAQLRTAPKPCCAVMITGAARTVAAREALAAGAECFLIKPVQHDELFDAMQRTVDRTRQWREQVEPIELPPDGPRLSVVQNEPEEPASQELRTLKALDIEWCADQIKEIGQLTDRERKILVRLLRGEQNNEIAAASGASPRTVKFHVSNILKKLRISQRAELMRFIF